ncbi:protein of unknown function [Methylocaldum szegediense]|uniref:Uncharacterized protein n=2 Tax=Methylocaldum szegediense TaxID=73780 RepID=A0ABN8X1C1_9GAMM|nr:protein of unknown function [Methylocaldum szegediense]
MRDLTCYAVDTWMGDEHAGWYGNEIFDELKNFNDKRYGHSHCDDRAYTLDSWPFIRDSIPAPNRIEIDQYEIFNASRRVARRLADFLCLDALFGEGLASAVENDRWEETLELQKTP